MKITRESWSLAAICMAGVMMAQTFAAEPDAKPVSDVLKSFVENKTLAGAVVLVANKEKVLTLEAVGFADIAANKPMSTDALFWIASMTKPVTAAAVMMLVDEGKLNLNDPVEKYLPEFKDLKVAEEKKEPHTPSHAITLREVLSHSSGMRFSSPQEKPTLDTLPLKEAVKTYAAMPLFAEPGTKYQYANAGINTAARVLEVVSGMSYEEFLQKRLFDPLEMKDTTFWPSEEQVKRVAKSYKPGPNKTGLEELNVTQLQYPLSDKTKRYPMPAGGLFSTAQDFARFAQMLLNGGQLDGKRYLSEAAVKEMSRKQTPDALKDNYGLGCSVGDGWFGHGGAYATNMHIDTRRGLVLIWMVQHAGFPGDGGKAQGEFKKAAEGKFGGK